MIIVYNKLNKKMLNSNKNSFYNNNYPIEMKKGFKSCNNEFKLCKNKQRMSKKLDQIRFKKMRNYKKESKKVIQKLIN